MEQPELTVEEMPTGDLVPYASNAKLHSQLQVEQIANSIEEFGFNDPVGVWENPQGDLEIVEGHGRVLAAEKLGIGTVPVIRLDHLTDEQRRAYTHVHNQTTLNSGFDLEILDAELETLDFDWESFGFEAGGEPEPGAVSYAEPDEKAPARVEYGQVWACGDHRVMCGDSSSAEDLGRLLRGGRPRFVFTDPPYGVAIGDKNNLLNAHPGKNGNKGNGRINRNIAGDTLGTEELYALLVRCFTNLREACDDSCSYYVSSPQGGELGLMMMMMRDAGLPVRHNLIWAKNQATFSMGRLDYDYKHEPIFYTWTKRHEFYGENETTVLEFDKPLKSKLHPTMKPVELVAHLMRNSSREGDEVCDIFGGSGTTMIAAEQLGRRACLMEVDPHYCDVMIKRWEDLTGREAVLAE